MKQLLALLAGGLLLAGCASDDDYSYKSSPMDTTAPTPTGVDDPGARDSLDTNPGVDAEPSAPVPDDPSQVTPEPNIPDATPDSPDSTPDSPDNTPGEDKTPENDPGDSGDEPLSKP